MALGHKIWRSCTRKVRLREHDAQKLAKRRGMRAYPCSWCGGWHLASRA